MKIADCDERRCIMAEIAWGKDLQEALGHAAESHKPVYLDFWFDG